MTDTKNASSIRILHKGTRKSILRLDMSFRMLFYAASGDFVFFVFFVVSYDCIKVGRVFSVLSGYLIQCNDEPRNPFNDCESGSKWPQRVSSLKGIHRHLHGNKRDQKDITFARWAPSFYDSPIMIPAVFSQPLVHVRNT